MTTAHVTVPSGRRVRLGEYARSWRSVASCNPASQIRGFDWCAMSAAEVRRALLAGLMDRINRHDCTRFRGELSQARLYTKIQRAAARGAIKPECRWCGCPLDWRKVNFNSPSTRFCSVQCARDYH